MIFELRSTVIILHHHFHLINNILITITVIFFNTHCVKSVRIWSYSGPYFPAFGLNTGRYGVALHIQSERRKMRTRITRNTDTFHAVTIIFMIVFWFPYNSQKYIDLYCFSCRLNIKDSNSILWNNAKPKSTLNSRPTSLVAWNIAVHSSISNSNQDGAFDLNYTYQLVSSFWALQ